MTSPELDNLVRIGSLKEEPGTRQEFDHLVRSGRLRLEDSCRGGLAFQSRFDLAYNAAHALALAALRWHGYRSEKRFVVFQAIPHTLGFGPEVWSVLAECHRRRNRAEYEGLLDEDEQLLADLVASASALLGELEKLGQVPGSV